MVSQSNSVGIKTAPPPAASSSFLVVMHMGLLIVCVVHIIFCFTVANVLLCFLNIHRSTKHFLRRPMWYIAWQRKACWQTSVCVCSLTKHAKTKRLGVRSGLDGFDVGLLLLFYLLHNHNRIQSNGSQAEVSRYGACHICIHYVLSMQVKLCLFSCSYNVWTVQFMKCRSDRI